MLIGLFFGSFNPVHIGHLIIAQAALELANLDEVWFIVSPQNPLKKNNNLLHEFDRYDMVEMAIRENDRFKVSDIEFHMPRPSYTIDTLTYLRSKYPAHQFRLIMGNDNLVILPKWKNSQRILDEFGIVVYPRLAGVNEKPVEHPNIIYFDAPLLAISATYIRECIKEGRSIRYLVPKSVSEHIDARKFYS